MTIRRRLLAWIVPSLLVLGLVAMARHDAARRLDGPQPPPDSNRPQGYFVDGPAADRLLAPSPAVPSSTLQRARVVSHSSPATVRSFQVEPAVRIDSGGTSAAAEVSMAAVGDTVVAAWIDLRSGPDRARVGAAVSEDFGITWSDRLLQPTGNPNSDDLHGDPMTAADPLQGHLWVGGLAFFDRSLFVTRYLSGTSDFAPTVTFGTLFISDKPWMAAGPNVEVPGTTRLYAVDVNGTFYISDDLGITWNGAGSADTGIGHLPRVSADGTLYVAYRGGPDTACRMQRSDDGGRTFHAATTVGPFQPFAVETFVPGEFRVPAFCVLAVDPTDGDLFMVTTGPIAASGGNTDLGILWTRSNDQGQTWTPPRIISGGVPDSDQFLPWLEIDDSGRQHLVYLDTRRIDQDDQDPVAWLDVYYSISDDGGQLWTEVPLTETPFDSGATAWLNNISQFVGDYLGLAVSENRAIVGYAATYGGDLDIYSQRVLPTETTLFSNGFEEGNVGGWDATSAGGSGPR